MGQPAAAAAAKQQVLKFPFLLLAGGNNNSGGAKAPAVSSSKEGEAALAAQRELDVLTQTMHAKYVDHLVANWICKPWVLEGKEIVLTKVEKGASFECINTDGLRGSVFTITLPENTLTEPLFNGYVVRFSGVVEQIALSPEIGKSFMMFVKASSMEILARSKE